MKQAIAIDHFVSGTCKGERCSMCDAPATHKVGEEMPSDDPTGFAIAGTWLLHRRVQIRHNYTAYVCCEHFRSIFGDAVPCPP